MRIMSESELRAGCTCVGCGAVKDAGLVVCWQCFKYHAPEPGVSCLKYFNGSTEEWQEMLAAARGERVERRTPSGCWRTRAEADRVESYVEHLRWLKDIEADERRDREEREERGLFGEY